MQSLICVWETAQWTVQMAASCLRIRVELQRDHRQDTGGTQSEVRLDIKLFRIYCPFLFWINVSDTKSGDCDNVTPTNLLSFNSAMQLFFVLSLLPIKLTICLCFISPMTHYVPILNTCSCVLLAVTSRLGFKQQDSPASPSCQTQCLTWRWLMAAHWPPRGGKWWTRM